MSVYNTTATTTTTVLVYNRRGKREEEAGSDPEAGSEVPLPRDRRGSVPAPDKGSDSVPAGGWALLPVWYYH